VYRGSGRPESRQVSAVSATTAASRSPSVPPVRGSPASGLAPDARSDLYSLGCVLCEMLSGETPYTAHTPMALMAKERRKTNSDRTNGKE
jgi:serine/threonine-protein kinase